MKNIPLTGFMEAFYNAKTARSGENYVSEAIKVFQDRASLRVTMYHRWSFATSHFGTPIHIFMKLRACPDFRKRNQEYFLATTWSR